MRLGRDIFAGMTMALASLPVFAAVSSMLQQAGMDFAGSFTASVLLSLVGTLWAAFKRYGVVLTPSLTVTGYLVFIAAISHGLGWQVILAISFLSSMLGLMLWQGRRWMGSYEWPAVFLWGIKLALAVFLICMGLKMGRIVITSAWQVTMLGDASDPLMYWSMAGIVLTTAMLAGGLRSAMFAGMAVIGGITFAEGFWVIPTAPFFLPAGLEKVAGQLSFHVGNASSEVFFGVTVFSLLVMLSAIHWSTFAVLSQKGEPRDGVRFLFALGTVGALCGVLPLVVSPVSSAGFDQNGRCAGLTAAAVLILALFCEPVIAAIADFPALVVPVLVGSGFYLLSASLKSCPLAVNSSGWQAEVLTVSVLVLLLSLTGNFATALGSAAIGYALFMSMAGKARDVAGMVWLISGIFTVYYIYGSIF